MIQGAACYIEERPQILAGRDDDPVPSPKWDVECEIQAGEVAIGAGDIELTPVPDESDRDGDPVTVFIDADASAGAVERLNLEEEIGRASCRERGEIAEVAGAEDGIRDLTVTGVQTCALPIYDPVPSPKWDVECEIQAGEVAIGAGDIELTPVPDESDRDGDPVTVFIDADASAGAVERLNLEE